MARLCERPGCSEHGAIAYGFDAERALVWLTPLDPNADRNRAGTLCVRHADAMVVPIGWTLEDARDPMPRLFKPATKARPARRTAKSTPSRPSAKRAKKPTSEQLPLDAPPAKPPRRPKAAPPTVAEVTGVAMASVDDPDATVAIPWMPEFDINDDLGGTLHAESPLLARAFRGVERRS